MVTSPVGPGLKVNIILSFGTEPGFNFYFDDHSLFICLFYRKGCIICCNAGVHLDNF